jgi:hypothetical protein
LEEIAACSRLQAFLGPVSEGFDAGAKRPMERIKASIREELHGDGGRARRRAPSPR